MFSLRLARFVLALAFAVLPLQGLAETVHVFLCQPQGNGDGAHASVHEHALPGPHARSDGGGAHAHDGPAHEHAAGGHASGAEHANADAADAAAAEGHAGHFCCDVVAAALPSAAVTVAKTDFPALQPAREVFHDSTFLEFPQRPPLI